MNHALNIVQSAQVEVDAARLLLSAALKEHVSLYWVLQNIMGLSDEEIQGIIKQRDLEKTN